MRSWKQVLVAGSAACAFAAGTWAACARRAVATAPAVAAQTPAATAGVAARAAAQHDAGFYLELGGVYERHGDLQLARQCYAHAVAGADSGAQSTQAALALARTNEALGDADAAIAALESARRGAAPESARRGAAGPRAAVAAADVVEPLGRLYVARGRLDDAARLYEQALADERAPRDRIVALQVELWRRRGQLDARIRELAASAAPDDDALRFLIAAYGPGAPPETLIPLYERLHARHPDDAMARQLLLALYERAGRVDDALALLRAGGASAAPSQCPGAPLSSPPIGAAATEVEAVRLLARAGRAHEALAATARLAARKDVPSTITSASLYAEQSRPELAERTLAAAARAAHTGEERRALQVAEADRLSRAGQLPRLHALYAAWRTSDDPCLREEAARRDPPRR
jgi:tetratricopeptide (TPR) repeat protein